jgi:hypothetical protein
MRPLTGGRGARGHIVIPAGEGWRGCHVGVRCGAACGRTEPRARERTPGIVARRQKLDSDLCLRVPLRMLGGVSVELDTAEPARLWTQAG